MSIIKAPNIPSHNVCLFISTSIPEFFSQVVGEPDKARHAVRYNSPQLFSYFALHYSSTAKYENSMSNHCRCCTDSTQCLATLSTVTCVFCIGGFMFYSIIA